MHGRLLAVILAVLAGVLNRAQAQDEPVTLSVKPLLCITDRRHQSCEMSFLITWQSTTVGLYCLYSDLEVDPIDCWREVSFGRAEDDRVITRSFSYWLTDMDPQVRLAEVIVEVLTTDSDDRRQNRRRRHAWSIL